MNLDTRIFLAINNFARETTWLHPLMTTYANDGVVVFAMLLLVGWWLARKNPDPMAMVATAWTPVGTVVALLVYNPIALSINRTRPCNALHEIVVLHCNTDAGFPSVHAVIAGAVAAGLWLVERRLGVIAALAAGLMAFARVYVGAHYPGDVLVGLALGALVSLTGYFVCRPLVRGILDRLGKTPLRVLITTSG